MEVEEVLERIGPGRTQTKLYYLIQTIHFPVMFHILVLTFIGIEPEWSCGENSDPTSKCLSYTRGECEPNYTGDITTVITEWNLICDKSSLINLSQSVFFIGAMLGAWLWGTVADRIGRKKVYFVTIFLSAASGLGYSLAPNYYIFLLFRFVVAICVAGVVLSSYVLSIELTGTKGRPGLVMTSSALYTVCYPSIALVAYFITNWRLLGVVNSLLGLLLLLLWRIIPESPRWLLVNGREQESWAVLSSIAAGNGTEMPAGRLQQRGNSTSTESISVLDLFKGRVIRRRTMTLFVVWFTNCMLYYVLFMVAGSGDLGGDRYINFSLSGLIEIPSFMAGWLLLDRFGRRLLHGSFLAGGGVACLIVAALQWQGSGDTLKITTAMIGKLAVSGSFCFIYMFSAELFPTQVRNIGAGVATIGARIGGIFAPLVLLLASYGAGLPMLVCGILGTLTGLLSLTLPETLNQPMPETLRELES